MPASHYVLNDVEVELVSLKDNSSIFSPLFPSVRGDEIFHIIVTSPVISEYVTVCNVTRQPYLRLVL